MSNKLRARLTDVGGGLSSKVNGDLGEGLVQMFATSQQALAGERRSEEQVSRVIERFLGTTRTSSNVDLDVITANFGSSGIPEEPSDFNEYLGYLADSVVAHSVNSASPRFIGHMVSALPFFVRPLGRLMVAINQNLVKVETSKAFSPFERQTLAWMHRLVYCFSDDFYLKHTQDRESTLGILVSGGTLANVTALWCARNKSLGPKDGFEGVEKEGLARALRHYGYKDAVIVGSSFMHYSLEKAACVLGLGSSGLIKVAVDTRNRINVKELQEALSRCRAENRLVLALVGIAGTTDTGSIDPLVDLAGLARENGTHFHVDAAWGGPLLFSKSHRVKLNGIDLADSVTIDGHKQMYLPMGTGIVVLRDPKMAEVIEKQARYIVRAGSWDLGKRALEGSRPAMALFLHAAMTVFGRRGYGVLIDEGIRKTQYMAAAIRERAEFELLAEPEMNILAYRYIPDHLVEKTRRLELTDSDNLLLNKINRDLQRTQRNAGCSFVSRTTLDSTVYPKGVPIVALRVVIANPLTAETDIDAILNEQIQIASDVSHQPN